MQKMFLVLMFGRLMGKFAIVTKMLIKLRYVFTNWGGCLHYGQNRTFSFFHNCVCVHNSHATAFHMVRHLFYFELILFFETMLKTFFLNLFNLLLLQNFWFSFIFNNRIHLHYLPHVSLLTGLSGYNVMSNSNLTFLANNCKGLQSSKKRKKLIVLRVN